MVASLVVVSLLAGCGGESDGSGAGPTAEFGDRPSPEKPVREMSITLDGYAGPENVGILMAKWEGYFDEVGIDLRIYSPNEPSRPVMYTVDGTVDVGIAREPQLVLAKKNGRPVVAIGTLIAEPTAAMIWLEKSGIDEVADLKGKTIATAGLPVQAVLLESVLKDAGLSPADVKLEDASYDLLSSLARGRFDVIFGANWNLEGIQLEEEGLGPVVTKVQDLGIPDYAEYLIIARRDRLEKEPQLFRDFMAAVSRGTATAIEDPDLASEVVREAAESDSRVAPAVKEVQVEATLPLLHESGEMDQAQAKRLIDWMHGEGMIRKKIPVSAVLTNEYLPRPGQ